MLVKCWDCGELDGYKMDVDVCYKMYNERPIGSVDWVE
jgi:hypothetical protein